MLESPQYKKTDCCEMSIFWNDWIHLAQNKKQWRALVNTVMNLRVPQKRGISCLSE